MSAATVGKWAALGPRVVDDSGATVCVCDGPNAEGNARCIAAEHNGGVWGEPLASSFWPLVDKDGPVVRDGMTPCWVWTGQRSPSGYGRINRPGRHTGAHRVAWEIENGPIQEGLIVLHSCDNRACCNPEHLSSGTNADNMADMKAKGRARTSDRLREFVKRGESHGLSRLTEDAVRTIRQRFSAGERRASLAREFGVSDSTITRVVRRECWAHVT